MKKFLTHFAISLVMFLGVWFGISQVEWKTLLNVKETTSSLEKSLGDLCLKIISRPDAVITDSILLKPLEKIKERICNDNGIDPQTIKIHFIRNSEINAFALPDNNLVIYTGIVDYCKNPEELAGVIAHEIAHIVKGHVMKHLAREIGLATLASLISNSTAGIEVLRTITSTAYSRSMEVEADETAILFLQNSGINPVGLVDLMYRLSTEENELMKYLTIISTHPNSAERAKRMLSLIDLEMVFEALLCQEEWKMLQSR
jgi:predicted Zn-dependent protease